jgi:hypothetical protein
VKITQRWPILGLVLAPAIALAQGVAPASSWTPLTPALSTDNVLVIRPCPPGVNGCPLTGYLNGRATISTINAALNTLNATGIPAAPGALLGGSGVAGTAVAVPYGTTAGTVAQGNDVRIAGALAATTAAATYVRVDSPVFTGTVTTPVIQAPYTGFNIPINGWDGSPQAAWGTTQGATEYTVWRGGLTGNGAVLTTASTGGTGVNVNLNIAPQGGGTVNVGNAYGQLFVFQPPTVTTTGYWVASSIASPAGVYLAAGPSGSINAGIAPSGTGAFMLAVPDGTATGGNARGQYAVDLQTYRAGNTQVATGTYAFQSGGANTTAGIGGASFGYGQHNSGVGSLLAGENGSDQARSFNDIMSFSYFTVPGDDQIGNTGLSGVSTGGAPIRLTADKLTAGAHNCMNVVSKETLGLRLRLIGHDYTATGHHMSWSNDGMLTTDGSLASAALLLGTPQVLGDTATVSLTADTTNGCINATVTPANSDTWHYVLRIDFVEAQ